ncbi:MAG: hypothetical protein WCV56_01000 [Candidatus Omnitrophota bacterium]
MNVSEYIEKLVSLNDRDREREVWRLAGPANSKFRQEVMTKLEGKKIPISKCGVQAICERLKITKKGSGDVKTDGKESRHSLMLKAKDRGIKNFRVLNKSELMKALAAGVTQQEIDAIVAGAVARWKSGWGKKKVQNES